MALKSKILQLCHKILKLSLVLTIGGGYLCSNSAAAQTNFSESRGAKINSNGPILQAQFGPEPVPFPPPINQPQTDPLPPPPPITFGEELEPVGGDMVGFPNLRYVVYVNGNSPWLLRILRDIESKSVLRKYQNRRVIQVGSFSDRFFAEDLANFFEFRGVKAQIVKLNSGEEFGRAVAREDTDLFPPVVQPINYGLGDRDAYYVLIPGGSRDLRAIQDQAILLGMPAENVFLIEVPANVAVGPFNSEVSARQWLLYLQEIGNFDDAQLYFGR